LSCRMWLQLIVTLLAALSVATTSSAFSPSRLLTESNQSSFLTLHSSSNRSLRLFTNNIRPTEVLTAAKQSDDQSRDGGKARIVEGIRLNKVFKATHSRRAADVLIGSGRVSVNGERVLEKGGFRVVPYQDVVKLDDVVVSGWEEMNALTATEDENNNQKRILPSLEMEEEELEGTKGKLLHFEYVKYWKPLGVTCTTDSKIQDNIIDSMKQRGYRPKHRVYPVGRLDKETTGLIILTSDGRLPNAVLRGEHKQPKVYQVLLDRSIPDEDINKLQNGIIITTVAQRDGKRAEPLTRRTRRCEVKRLGPRNIEITLTEGRNRQIRKMVGALNYAVVTLRRVKFMGIRLQCTRASSPSDLNGPGDWALLDDEELRLVKNALANNKIK